MSTAKIFWSGRSQAVRLPKAFRFDTETVRIHKEGNAIVLEPVTEDWKWLNAISRKLDQDFIDASNEQSEQQKRPTLDKIFK